MTTSVNVPHLILAVARTQHSAVLSRDELPSGEWQVVELLSV